MNELPVKRKYNISNTRIFPIIIVHDSLYSAAALNFWIHYWFDDEIKTLKSDPKFKGFDFSRIMPLTIIEIDTLILYENCFIDKRFDLVRLIESYHDYVRFDLVGKVAPDKIEEHARRSAVPFSECVRDIAHSMGIVIDFKILSEMLKKYGIN